HVLRIIRELIDYKPKSQGTNLSEALKFLTGVQKKKAIVFVISDFIADDYLHTLKIVSKKHDVTGIRVFDEKEQKLPNIGLVPMMDAETGTQKWVDTGSKKVRLQYENYFHEKSNYFKEVFSKCGAGVINTRADEDYALKLLGYFKAR